MCDLICELSRYYVFSSPIPPNTLFGVPCHENFGIVFWDVTKYVCVCIGCGRLETLCWFRVFFYIFVIFLILLVLHKVCCWSELGNNDFQNHLPPILCCNVSMGCLAEGRWGLPHMVFGQIMAGLHTAFHPSDFARWLKLEAKICETIWFSNVELCDCLMLISIYFCCWWWRVAIKIVGGRMWDKYHASLKFSDTYSWHCFCCYNFLVWSK